jgi:hypothetical protein
MKLINCSDWTIFWNIITKIILQSITTVKKGQPLNSWVPMFAVRVMVFNATFNNISVILWWTVLLVEESGVPGEKNQSAARH